MAIDLPPSLAPPPEVEALQLGLEALIFDPIASDQSRREAADDTETPPLRAYVLADGSAIQQLPIYAESFAEEARCLFDGEAFEDLADVAPWLIELRRHGDAMDWVHSKVWGQNAGILVLTRLSISKLKTHFKKFIRVEDEDGEAYYFKFYRSEHLNTYLPVFEVEEQTRILKDIDAIISEEGTVTTTALVHRMRGGKLETFLADLPAMGEPLRIKPPTDEEVAEILAKMKQSTA